mmetsp:Transcript_13019/g.14326  ORF Transcript_13019/g.14326 Transcript_13019/m.14326 type:complete len:367 (+) Transcript_13019:21-1121(+)
MKNSTYWLIIGLVVSLGQTVVSFGGLGLKDSMSVVVPFIDCDEITPQVCEVEETTGTVEIREHQVAYRIYSPKNIPLSKIPLVTVHGGPGGPPTYMQPLKMLACEGREVIFYDQMGCGQSWIPENIEEQAPWLLTIEYYAEEVQAVVDHLGYDKIFLFGHSWGAMVAQEYAATQPQELVAMMLSGPAANSQTYIEEQWAYNFSTLPQLTQEIFHQIDETKDYGSSTNEFVNFILTTQFVTRQVPMASCYMAVPPNLDIFVKMQGESSFSVGGVLADYDFTDKIPTIKVPSLIIHGQFDTMQGETVNVYNRLLPDSRGLVTVPRSGHLTMIDAPEELFRFMNDFMEDVEDEEVFKSFIKQYEHNLDF